MAQLLNRPQTLAYEPLDSEHVLACARTAYPAVQGLVESCGKGKWLQHIQSNAPKACCHDPANLEIEAWFSKPLEQQKGAPDLYKFYCTVCETGYEQGTAPGYCHAVFCVGGGDERPMWEAR